MRAELKKAKFYCENCGVEVPESAKICNYCGRFFSSVRCPKCGATGSTSQFTNGCPKCGYAAAGNNISQIGKSSNRNGSNFFSFSKKKRGEDAPLPIWIYLLTVIALGVIVAFVYVLTS